MANFIVSLFFHRFNQFFWHNHFSHLIITIV
jgi:hypothetical protein